MCFPDFSAISHARKLRKVLNQRENCAPRYDRVGFFIFDRVFEKNGYSSYAYALFVRIFGEKLPPKVHKEEYKSFSSIRLQWQMLVTF